MKKMALLSALIIAMTLVGTCCISPAWAGSPDAQQCIDSGDLFFAKGEYDTAQQLYEKALLIDPDNYDAWMGLGMTFSWQDKESQAAEAFIVATELRPEKIRPLVDLALSYKTMENTSENITVLYEKAITLQPEDNDAADYYLLGVAYGERGQYQEALDSIAVARALKPSESLYYSVGIDYAGDSGDYEGAVAIARNATTQFPKTPRYYNSIAWWIAQKNTFDADEALTAVDMALSLPGGRVPYIIDTKGYIYLVTDRPAEALPFFEEALKTGGDSDGDILTHAGDAQYALGRYDEAAASYSSALTLDSDYIDAWRGVMKTAIAQGQPDDAQAAANEILRIDETDIEAAEFLNRCDLSGQES